MGDGECTRVLARMLQTWSGCELFAQSVTGVVLFLDGVGIAGPGSCVESTTVSGFAGDVFPERFRLNNVHSIARVLQESTFRDTICLQDARTKRAEFQSNHVKI